MITLTTYVVPTRDNGREKTTYETPAGRENRPLSAFRPRWTLLGQVFWRDPWVFVPRHGGTGFPFSDRPFLLSAKSSTRPKWNWPRSSTKMYIRWCYVRKSKRADTPAGVPCLPISCQTVWLLPFLKPLKVRNNTISTYKVSGSTKFSQPFPIVIILL